MSPDEIKSLQKAIYAEGLDGWLFCNFRHRDFLADELLGLSSKTSNSRLWIYAIPAKGKARKILHKVEPLALEGLSGEEDFYVSRRELAAILKSLAGKSWGVQVSENLPAISYLDAGTAAFFRKAGLKLVSAAGLIQRSKALLDEKAIASHERSSVQLYGIVDEAWKKVKSAYHSRKPVWEGDLRSFILSEIKHRGLYADHEPIVAAGPNAGNPHYDFSGRGAKIRGGDVIQFDLWAKEKNDKAIYADISWAGFFGTDIPPLIEKNFSDLVSAREGALAFIEDEFRQGSRPSGAMVDRKARDILIKKGYRENLKHRTGHGIDTEVHGSGVNIDSVEFPDERLLLDGSCFSLEPGIYFKDRGFRTEIDVYISRGKPVVSGKSRKRQFTLLLC